MDIIGRNRERLLLDKLSDENKSHFVAVYGRRRIGKTFLIRSHFKEFTFYHTGIINIGLKDQLKAFDKALSNYSKREISKSKDWFDAFDSLKQIIAQSKRKKKNNFY